MPATANNVNILHLNFYRVAGMYIAFELSLTKRLEMTTPGVSTIKLYLEATQNEGSATVLLFVTQFATSSLTPRYNTASSQGAFISVVINLDGNIETERDAAYLRAAPHEIRC